MINRETLFSRMADGAIVLTPTKRLALELLQNYFSQNNKKDLIKPECLNYQNFVENQFAKFVYKNPFLHHPVLLNNQQMRYLWQQVIQEQGVVLNPNLIEAVHDAWVKCHYWQLDLKLPAFAATEQTQLFQNWALSMQEILNSLFAISEEQIIDYLSINKWSLEKNTIIWACFDHYTPQQRQFQAYLQQQGCEILHTALNHHRGSSFLLAAPNERIEYEQMLFWLKQQLAIPTKRIAIVVPNLQTNGVKITQLIEANFPDLDFAVSLGQPLSAFPLIGQALMMLALDGKCISNHHGQLLLYTPFLIDSQHEFFDRARAVREASCFLEDEIDWSYYIQSIARFAPRLAKVLANLTAYPEKASPESWRQCFYQRLRELGFPGENKLRSDTFQYYQRLLNLLDELQFLQLLNPVMSREEILAVLQQMANSTLFQPEKKQARLHILGLLEIAGTQFDAIWVSAMNDEALPLKGRPSAFIPLPLQKKYQLPHADVERELNLAISQLNAVEAASPTIVFSYSKVVDDRVQLVNPLLDDRESYSILTVEQENPPAILEKFQDIFTIPLTLQENIRGGTSILTKQAQCPFQAFAAHRLNAATATPSSPGLNNLERGQLIHKVLELIWLELDSQEKLLAKSESDTNQLINKAIAEALQPFQQKRHYSFSPLIQKVEKERLHRLIKACLSWEKQRENFRILALEKEFTYHLAGIEFNLRVDRLDELNDGRYWVIDYKSSPPTSLPWYDERPREPQLLLYALLDDKIDSLIFLALKEGEIVCKGLSGGETDLPGIKKIEDNSSWSEQREHWRQTLETIADEFNAGICQPQPLNQTVCQRCDYQSLCRYHLKEAENYPLSSE